MNLNTLIYIDGENLRKAITKYKFSTTFQGVNKEYGLSESLIDWRGFFDGVIAKIDQGTGFEHRLVGARWYLANQVRVVAGNYRNKIECLQECRRSLPNLTEQELVGASEKWIVYERDRVRTASEEIREKLQRKHDFLTFIYVGEFLLARYNLHDIQLRQNNEVFYQGKRRGERGVDVGMAVDMVTQLRNVDAVVLLSGDRDFIPVINYLKTKTINVYSFALARGVPPNIEYVSPWLTGAVDHEGSFDELELLNNYLDGNEVSNLVGPGMVQAISERIVDLQRP